jgi:hypothetical protein
VHKSAKDLSSNTFLNWKSCNFKAQVEGREEGPGDSGVFRVGFLGLTLSPERYLLCFSRSKNTIIKNNVDRRNEDRATDRVMLND